MALTRSWTTPDLCDAHPTEVAIAEPLLRDFGGRARFSGPIVTLRVQDDNALIRATLETPTAGCVLVVDGGGSTRCALLGDRLGELAVTNHWVGVIVHGCVRDSDRLALLPLGVRALNTCPRRGGNGGGGDRDVPVTFAGVTFRPGHWVYADADGILVAPRRLTEDETSGNMT